jgi:hypothetical protein
MTGALPPEYPHILGDEIRRHRMARGWILNRLRQELSRVGSDLSLETLATYELGTRSMIVIRLARSPTCWEPAVPTYSPRPNDVPA